MLAWAQLRLLVLHPFIVFMSTDSWSTDCTIFSTSISAITLPISALFSSDSLHLDFLSASLWVATRQGKCYFMSCATASPGSWIRLPSQIFSMSYEHFSTASFILMPMLSVRTSWRCSGVDSWQNTHSSSLRGVVDDLGCSGSSAAVEVGSALHGHPTFLVIAGLASLSAMFLIPFLCSLQHLWVNKTAVAFSMTESFLTLQSFWWVVFKSGSKVSVFWISILTSISGKGK